jgi:hypothetical protein
MSLIQLLKIVWKLNKKSLIFSFLVLLIVLSFININLENYDFNSNRNIPTGYFLLSSGISTLFLLPLMILLISIILFWKMRKYSRVSI